MKLKQKLLHKAIFQYNILNITIIIIIIIMIIFIIILIFIIIIINIMTMTNYGIKLKVEVANFPEKRKGNEKGKERFNLPPQKSGGCPALNIGKEKKS